MGKSILVKGGNFKSVRPGIPKALMPNNVNHVRDLLIGSKYVENEGWINAGRVEDADKPEDEVSRAYSYPDFVESSGIITGRSLLRYNRGSSNSGDVLRLKPSLGDTFSFTVVFLMVDDLSDELCPFGFTFGDEKYLTALRIKDFESNPESMYFSTHEIDWVQLFETQAGQRDIVTVQQGESGTKIYHLGNEVYSNEDMIIPGIDSIDIGQRSIIESSMNPFDGVIAYAETATEILSPSEVLEKHDQLAAYYALD